MDKNIFLDRLDLLTKLGFGEVPDCDPSYAFRTSVVALNTNIIVRGDHADDVAYIYYSCIQKDEELLDGFFYAPSLLEHPWLNYQILNIDSLLEEINQHVYCPARFVCVGGIPMLFIEISEYDWKMNDLHSPLSDMLKLIGIMDYFLSREFNRKIELFNKK